MYPVKLKFAVSTFLLIFFYFPKSINGHIESATCDVKNSCIKHDKFDRKIFFGPQFRERETRMVNVRNRVGSEKLVNNRRIVDSDSRISDDIQSRNFDFPRLSRNSRDERTNRISRARIIPRLTRDVFETIQTRRDIHTRASRVTERDSRNRIETGNTRRALVDNLDRESRTRRIVDARESRLRESREIRLSTDNVRNFERLPRGVDMARRQSRVSPIRRDVRTDQTSRISRLFNNREIYRHSRTESRLGIDSNSREQPSDERREQRSLDVSTREANRRLLEKESRERETLSHANNHRRIVDRDSRVPPVESRLIIDNRRLSERVERSSQRRDSERASREVRRGLQMRSLESQTTRLTERIERNSPDRRNSERASREVSRGLQIRDIRNSQIRSLESQTTRLIERRDSERASREVTRTLPVKDARNSQIRSLESQTTRLTERVERSSQRRDSERASREVNRGLPIRQPGDSQIRSPESQTTRLTERVERSSQRRERFSREVSRELPMRDVRASQIRSLESQTTRLTARAERRDSERASREVSIRLPIRESRDSQMRSLGSQTTRLTQRIERSSPDRRNSERASREVNRRLSERDSHERDTRASHTTDRRVLLDRDSRVRTIESRVTSQNTIRVERRRNSERASREINTRITEDNARMRQIRTTDANGSRVRNIRITENRDSRIRSNEPRQTERVTGHRHIQRDTRTVNSYGINNQRVGDGDSQIPTQKRSPVRLVESRRTTKNLDRREQRNTSTERRDSREGRTGATERRISTTDEIRNNRIQEDRRIVNKREMTMNGASNDRSIGERERQSENRNIRRGERRISDNGRREHPVDINNNRRTDINNNRRRITDQQRFTDSSRERSNGYQPNTIRMKSSENYIIKWSNLFTTTFGILLLTQIITSSNTKKYGIPQITSFLHGVKEKVY